MERDFQATGCKYLPNSQAGIDSNPIEVAELNKWRAGYAATR